MKLQNNFFEPSRFTFLLKREVSLAVKTLMYVALTTYGIYLLVGFLSLWNGHSDRNVFNTESLITSLSFMCIIWASVSFHEMANTPGRQFYLGLPASTFEKLGSKWLTISILIPVLFVVGYILVGYVAHFFSSAFMDYKILPPQIKIKQLTETMLGLMLAQSAFYLGSIVWPKHSIFKTGISLFAIFAFLAFISFIFFRVVFHEHFNGFAMESHNNNLNIKFNPFESYDLPGKIFLCVLYVLLMTASYFKLKEKEL